MQTSLLDFLGGSPPAKKHVGRRSTTPSSPKRRDSLESCPRVTNEIPQAKTPKTSHKIHYNSSLESPDKGIIDVENNNSSQ